MICGVMEESVGLILSKYYTKNRVTSYFRLKILTGYAKGSRHSGGSLLRNMVLNKGTIIADIDIEPAMACFSLFTYRCRMPLGRHQNDIGITGIDKDLV